MTDPAPLPPVAERRPNTREHHGHTLVDEYAWLAQADSPEVLAHLQAESDYARARTAHLDELTEQVLGEMRSRIVETDVSVPVLVDGWWYFVRTSEGEQYEQHCRVPDAGRRPTPTPGELVREEQVVIDGNREAAGQEFYEIGDLDISPDGRRAAVLVDLVGDERYDLQVRDIASGEVLDDVVRQGGVGLAWSADGSWLFYTRRDDAWRCHQVWRHEVGSAAEADVLVHEEPDEQYSLGIEASRDQRWLVVTSESRLTTEVHLLDLQEPTSSPRLVHPREHGLDYAVEVDGDRLLVTHNGALADFELAWTTIDAPGREHWQRVLAAGEGERVQGATALSGVTAVSLRENGLPGVRLLRRTTDGYEAGPPVERESDLTSVHVGHNPTYDASGLLLVTESWVRPRRVVELDVADGTTRLLKEQQVPGLDATAYVEERHWATADDGTRIPMSVVRRRETGPGAPGLVYGYGAYEASMDPYFSVSRLSMLDRGLVFCVAHVRGGGEMGRRWYDEGKLAAKPNTFTDFVACSRELIDSGLVAPGRLAAEGGSAGGLLIGAALNLAPELYRVVHAAVPFVDALTTMLQPELPLTVGEWEEWGDPLHDPAAFACMRGYSPYENVRAVEYPTVLASTNLHDTRVLVAEPAKWVQRLRATVTSDPAQRPVLLKVDMDGGHAGHSGRYDAWRQTAFEIAFLLSELDVTPRPRP